MASVTQRFLFPVSTISARNARHNDLPFCVINTKENGLKIMSLAAYTSETNYKPLDLNQSKRETCIEQYSLRASSPFGGYREKYTRERHARRDATAAPRGFAARSRVRARLASLAQIGELARRL